MNQIYRYRSDVHYVYYTIEMEIVIFTSTYKQNQKCYPHFDQQCMVKSLQIIWRSGTTVPNLQMICSNLT